MGRRIIQPGDGDRAHGTAYGYSVLKCGKQPEGPRTPCEPCKEARRTYYRGYARGDRIIQPGDGDSAHGTMYGYNQLRCGKQPDGTRQTCPECAEASRNHARRRARKFIQPGDGDPRHGTVNGYGNLQCGRQPDGSRRSCQRCKEAWRIQHLEYMHRAPGQMERHRRYEQAKREAKRQQFGVPYGQVSGS